MALRIARLSPARYHGWRRAETRCELDDRSSCPRSKPTRLAAAEVRSVKEMVESDDHRHLSLRGLARHAQRIGRVVASPSTWSRLAREGGWRRPRRRVYPAKPKEGIRAYAPNELWHIDVTVSRPGESHPRALAEPDVNVSAHPAPIIQPPAPGPFANARIDRDHVRPRDLASASHGDGASEASCTCASPTASAPDRTSARSGTSLSCRSAESSSSSPEGSDQTFERDRPDCCRCGDGAASSELCPERIWPKLVPARLEKWLEIRRRECSRNLLGIEMQP